MIKNRNFIFSSNSEEWKGSFIGPNWRKNKKEEKGGKFNIFITNLDVLENFPKLLVNPQEILNSDYKVTKFSR